MVDFYADDLTLKEIQMRGDSQIMVFKNCASDCDETVSIGVDDKELLNIYERVRMRCETLGIKKEDNKS